MLELSDLVLEFCRFHTLFTKSLSILMDGLKLSLESLYCYKLAFEAPKILQYKLFGSDLAKVKQANEEYGDMSFSHCGQCLDGILA